MMRFFRFTNLYFKKFESAPPILHHSAFPSVQQSNPLRRFYMAHITVPEAEKLLDRTIPVLDKGFVRLVDYMGGDARIVQTARVSYGEGTKTVREDAGLIDYLLRHEHTSPFEHVVFELHCKMPIFVARQWIRHRTARLNEISGRYSVMKDEFYLPPREQIAMQSTDNKQGREQESVPVELQDKVLDLLKSDQSASYANYSEILNDGIARELARINLPLSMYTEWYWQMDLKNMLHFLKLRMDSHAQWEIQEYARAIAGIVKAVCPLAYESFDRHILRGAKFSSDEIAAIHEMLAGRANPLKGRRLTEFEDKLKGNLSLFSAAE
jgi:thymidylate synthase (FAD)